MDSVLYLSASDIADARLPGLPTTRRGVHVRAARDGWPFVERSARGGPVRLYPASALPDDARAALATARNVAPAEPDDVDTMPETSRDRARERLAVVTQMEALIASGTTRARAAELACEGKEYSSASALRWFVQCQARPRAEWFALLVPQWKSKSEPTEIHPEAWARFRDDYLRAAKPSFATCYARMKKVALHQGWTPIPSVSTFVRRFHRDVAEHAVVLRREGEEALASLYPAQQRTRAHFHALFAVNADGHKIDVFVRWPEVAEPVRVVLLAWQDLYSGMILGWRIERVESADVVRLAFGDVVEKWGIPEHAYLDNGRAFASKGITGGIRNRFRFKVRPGETNGVLTQLGVKVHWTTPYSGKSKPIERAFRDLCETIAKHPAFEGAYTGNSPDAKPANYGSRAVDLDTFLRVVDAQIREHNTREDRDTEVCRGRSFEAAFLESYATSPIRKATEAQRRFLLLAAEGVRVRADATVHLMGNRYWTESLVSLRGTDVVVRFDPHHLKKGVFVYRNDGTFVAFASCIEAVGFDDTAAAREHVRKRREFVRAAKKAADAEQRFSAAELAAAHLAAQGVELPSPPPSARVIKPMFGGERRRPMIPSTERAPLPAVTRTAEEEARQQAREDLLSRVGANALATLKRRAVND